MDRLFVVVFVVLEKDASEEEDEDEESPVRADKGGGVLPCRREEKPKKPMPTITIAW